MTRTGSSQSGYIALMATLVIGAVSLSITLAVLAMGVTSQKTNLVVQQSAAARNLAHACAEDALEQIHDLTTYVGSGTLTFASGTCSYTVASTGTSTRTITTSSTINGVARKAQLSVTIGASSISVTAWQEVI